MTLASKLGRELRSCVEVEVALQGSPSLISLIVYVDVKQHRIKLGLLAWELRD